MSLIVVLDACVIFPMPLCDTLLRTAEAGFYRPHFSQKILDEATRNLIKQGRMQTDKADRYQFHIKAAFPEAMIEPSEQIINSMTNHPKDRHVAAVAVQAKADLIVTFNLKDFPQESLALFGIEAKHPDDFLLDLCDICTTRAMAEVIQEQAEALKNPPTTVKDLLGRLSLQLPKFAGEILCYEYGHK